MREEALKRRLTYSNSLPFAKTRRCDNLVLGSLSSLTTVLLRNWRWRFSSEKKYLWKQVAAGKFEEQSEGWCSLFGKKGYGVGLISWF